MKKYLKDLFQAFKNACTTFTLIVFAVYLVVSIMGKSGFPFPVDSIPWVFLVSIWFAISNLIFHIKRLDPIVRTLLHFVAYTIGFYFVMHFIEEYNSSSSGIAFVSTVVFSTLYLIVAMSIFLVLHFIHRKKNEEEDYTPAFDKKKKEDTNKKDSK